MQLSIIYMTSGSLSYSLLSSIIFDYTRTLPWLEDNLIRILQAISETPGKLSRANSNNFLITVLRKITFLRKKS